jgi:TolA-binding protein
MRISFVPSMLVLALSANIAAAQDATLEPVVNAANAITQSARSSQLTVETIADTTQERVQQYKQIMRQIEGLEVYTQQLQKQIANQTSEKAELNLSIDEVSVVERQITPLMLRMITALDAFIDLDVPFLGRERDDRIAHLNDLMERADVDVSEKFRRVMEAYQIEADYGRNIEAYNGVMDIDGQAQDVEFLRIGRLVLIYKTRDGSRMGVWNQQQKHWQALDSSYNSGVQEAIRIARKQLAPDLLMLPINTSSRGE